MPQGKAASVPQRWLLVVIGSAWLAGIFLSSLVAVPPLMLLIGAGTALVLLIVLWQDHQARLVLVLLCCLQVGAWRYSIALPANTPQSIVAYIGRLSLQIRGTVADEPRLQGRSRTLRVAVSQVSSDGGRSWQGATGDIAVYTTGVFIEDPYGANYGDVIKLQGKLQAPDPRSSPTIVASMAFPRIYVQGSGGNPIIGWLYHVRVLLANGIARALPQPEAAVLIALLLSLRTPALKPLAFAFNVTGTAHLIAPSGFKVTVLAGTIARVMSRLEKRARSYIRWLTVVARVTVIVVYTLLSGAGPAALRAGIMGTLVVLASCTGRAYNIYTSLAFAALLMTAIEPFLLRDTGFLLSFSGTLGIVLLTPFFERLLHPMTRLPFGQMMVEIIAVTLAAQVATFPITAVAFQEISLIAPLTNLLTVPLLCALLLLGLVVGIGGLLPLSPGNYSGWIAEPVMQYVVTVINICASLPAAYITTGPVSNVLAWGYYLLLAIPVSLLLRRKAPSTLQKQQWTGKAQRERRLLLVFQACAAALILLGTGISIQIPRSNGNLSISFLDVGPEGAASQGEAIFVRTARGETVLIDGGLDTASLSQELDTRLPSWQRTLDVVVLTSSRPEHITGLLDIIQRFQIKAVIDAGMLHPNTTYALWRRTITERNLRYQSVREGATIPIGTEAVLQVLRPRELHKGSNEARDNALVVRIQTSKVHVLLLGDAAQSNYALTGLLTDVASNYLQAEIVQMVGESSKEYPTALKGVLQKAHPRALIITPPLLRGKQSQKAVGGDPATPHPLLSVLPNCQVIQTAQTGTVDIESNNNGWTMNIL